MVTSNNFKNIPEGFTFECSKHSLKKIYVSISHLNHHGFKAFTECSRLKQLFVSSNDFRDLPDTFSFGSAKHTLIDLNVSNCKLYQYGLKAIKECTKLKILNISDIKLSNYFKETLRFLNKFIETILYLITFFY